MLEVFKTNVQDRCVADKIISEIHKTFVGYQANFDLEDCDNILRVKSLTGSLECTHLSCFLKELGCDAEILEDEIKSCCNKKSVNQKVVHCSEPEITG